VLVPIVVRESGLTLLLTQRTAHLRDHAGQVSFPGGRSEPEDGSPVATALREAQEEVGIDPSQVEVIGHLPDYCTGTGFRVTPVVGLVSPPLNLRLDDFEVAEVFEPPLSFLLDARNHQRHSMEVRGAMREYWAMPWQGFYIWGATAGMLVSLHRFLYEG
jgi:8-oxo-dGTP pyrophosphatase MutT (NUDIX family)